ncbi:hypothetical protein ACFL17_09265 [Pseudomonadota bacterium]
MVLLSTRFLPSSLSNFTGVVYPLLILTSFLVITVSHATAPSTFTTYLNRGELFNLTKSHFGPDALVQVQNIVMENTGRRSSSNNIYGDSFESLDNRSTLMRVFRHLWKTADENNMSDKFGLFLAELNRKPVIRGFTRTPRFSGCVLVSVEIQPEGDNQYMLMKYKAHQFPGCNSTYGKSFKTSTRFILR